MFYGLYSEALVIPDSLYPSPLTRLDIPVPESQTQKTPDREENSGRHSKNPKKISLYNGVFCLSR